MKAGRVGGTTSIGSTEARRTGADAATASKGSLKPGSAAVPASEAERDEREEAGDAARSFFLRAALGFFVVAPLPLPLPFCCLAEGGGRLERDLVTLERVSLLPSVMGAGGAGEHSRRASSNAMTEGNSAREPSALVMSVKFER